MDFYVDVKRDGPRKLNETGTPYWKSFGSPNRHPVIESARTKHAERCVVMFLACGVQAGVNILVGLCAMALIAKGILLGRDDDFGELVMAYFVHVLSVLFLGAYLVGMGLALLL